MCGGRSWLGEGGGVRELILQLSSDISYAKFRHSGLLNMTRVRRRLFLKANENHLPE